MKNKEAGGAGIVAPPAGAQRWEMLTRSTHRIGEINGANAAGKGFQSIGKLSNGVVRRLRWTRALN